MKRRRDWSLDSNMCVYGTIAIVTAFVLGLAFGVAGIMVLVNAH